MIRGRFYVTPYAVRRFRERVRPDLAPAAALERLIALTTGGRFVTPWRGRGILEAAGVGVRVELWRAPRVGTSGQRSPESRVRFVVAHGRGGAPQVVTVLPNPKGRA
jgi:hypothetical protein